ncbi:hypothetical protein NL676_038507 [Syzygium grande]|nr:hypothetical protein NL676_038507 [Syzygium grande]
MGIGKDGKLPLRLPSDLKFLKSITLSTIDPGKKNAVITGRKTWGKVFLLNIGLYLATSMLFSLILGVLILHLQRMSSNVETYVLSWIYWLHLLIVYQLREFLSLAARGKLPALLDMMLSTKLKLRQQLNLTLLCPWLIHLSFTRGTELLKNSCSSSVYLQMPRFFREKAFIYGMAMHLKPTLSISHPIHENQICTVISTLTYRPKGFDQLLDVIHKIKNNPDDN